MNICYWIKMKNKHVNEWINEYKWTINDINELLNLDEYKWINEHEWTINEMYKLMHKDEYKWYECVIEFRWI